MEQIKRVRPVYLFYVILFAFMVNRLFFFSPGISEQTISCLVYPVVKIQSMLSSPFASISIRFKSISELQKKIDTLEQENEQLQEKIIRQAALHFFSEESKEVVEFGQRYDNEQKKLVKVLLTVISEKEDSIIIDAGSCNGISKDDVVIYKNMLVGRVLEIYLWYSKVALYTDKRCKISAQSRPGVEGICSGQNNGQIEFDFVPHFKEVEVGDIVISTGNGLVYPQGFALGEIISCKTDNVVHKIHLKPMLDLRALSYVYVFKRSGSEQQFAIESKEVKPETESVTGSTSC